MENSKFESFQTLHLLLISMSNGKTVENIAEDKNSRDCFLLFNQKPVKLIQNKNYYPLEGQYVNYIKGKYYFDESTKSIKCERGFNFFLFCNINDPLCSSNCKHFRAKTSK